MNDTRENPFRVQEEELPGERFEPESPFVGSQFLTEAWVERETPGQSEALEQQWTPRVETPFVSQYFEEAPVNLEAQRFTETLQQLFDTEFNEAVETLASEATAESLQLTGSTSGTTAELHLTEWLDPLRRATEQLLEQLGEAASHQQLEALSDSELDSFLESHTPQPGTVPPHFEGFLGKVWNKIKNVARTAVNLAKKGVVALGKLAMPVGILLKKLSGLVRPLLNRVIRFAIGKLPSSLRPAANLLGKKLGILQEAWASEAGEAEAMPSAESIAQEFDAATATLLLAHDEGEQEMLLEESTQEPAREAESNALAEVDAARERFVEQFAQLKTSDNPGPVIQQFLPALLPVLRVGINVIGRDRIVNFLANYLAKIIRNYVGPDAATALSRALVDVGLRLMTFETEAEPPRHEAARVVAATLEDTVRRIASFGFEQFEGFAESVERQQLLESVSSEAFFEAAANHFPPQLLDTRRLEERGIYLESSAQPGIFVYRPRPRFKKYTRIFEALITPQIAAQIKSFGNQPLDTFLRARNVRLPGTMKIHVYEAIPGTTLSAISALERRTPGLGSGREEAWSKIHPLTTQAAGLLLREPALGRDVEANFLQSRNRIGVGQRLYYIELPTPSSQVGKVGRASEVNITIDLPSNQVRVSVFFSEADAQRIVAAGPSVGPMTAVRLAQGVASSVIGSITSGGPTNHVKFNREATGIQGEEFWQAIAGEAGKRAVRWLLEELAKALLQLVKAALIRYFNSRLNEFAQATRNSADGVTVVLIFAHPGLQMLRAALSGRLPNLSDIRSAARNLQFPSISIVPGFVRR